MLPQFGEPLTVLGGISSSHEPSNQNYHMNRIPSYSTILSKMENQHFTK